VFGEEQVSNFVKKDLTQRRKEKRSELLCGLPLRLCVFA
jgi:hypothetical protein